ncbi:hypothetical protein N657DRAFT_656248 [Parathielavia appendiculata]|uniref:Phosphoglycerate mutase n=1 Tax=Parathielavia appendiculata TaxID=2587402 RepID=A0AAN6Z362_9PEZI|nr:hypothetical protein N657DRAFT_656248 [Parathielavia appendiculata]
MPIPTRTIPEYRFSYVPDYFVDGAEAAKTCLDFKLTAQPNLGLLERAYDNDNAPELARGDGPWAQFSRRIEWLNTNIPYGVSYKLLYLLRHGLSVHNIVMAKVGRDAWNGYWSHLEGDGELTWVDARLTEDGIKPSRTSRRPLDTLYTSPLARYLETTKLVYEPVMAKRGESLDQYSKLLRERLTNHTCDKRSTRAHDLYETNHEHVARKRRLLADIFANDKATFVSLTTHSCAISAVLGRAVLPLLVKAEEAVGERA